MFYEWKSGDYTLRGMKPYYYVLIRENDEDLEGEDETVATEDIWNYPVESSEVLGKWETIHFVDNIEYFDPDGVWWREDALFLKELYFKKTKVGVKIEGSSKYKYHDWLDGTLIDEASKTASKFTIMNIEGEEYMFYEWKSGDYTNRGMKPQYYVLRKQK